MYSTSDTGLENGWKFFPDSNWYSRSVKVFGAEVEKSHFDLFDLCHENYFKKRIPCILDGKKFQSIPVESQTEGNFSLLQTMEETETYNMALLQWMQDNHYIQFPFTCSVD